MVIEEAEEVLRRNRTENQEVSNLEAPKNEEPKLKSEAPKMKDLEPKSEESGNLGSQISNHHTNHHIVWELVKVLPYSIWPLIIGRHACASAGIDKRL